MLSVGFWFYNLVVLPVFTWGFGFKFYTAAVIIFPESCWNLLREIYVLITSCTSFGRSFSLIVCGLFLLNNLNSSSNSFFPKDVAACYFFSSSTPSSSFSLSFLPRICSIQSQLFACFLTLYFYQFILGTSVSPSLFQLFCAASTAAPKACGEIRKRSSSSIPTTE